MNSGEFELLLTDYSKFVGNLFWGDWNKIPVVPIKSLRFSFLDRIVIMEDFEEYNILVERVSVLNGNNKGTQTILNVYVVGRERSHSVLYEYSMQKMRVFKRIKCKFSEFNVKNVTGWKKGVYNKITKENCI